MKRFHFYRCGNFNSSYGEELALFQTDLSRLWFIAGLIIVFGLIPLTGSCHVLKVLNLIGIYSIAAIGLNILTGYTGEVSLGHSAIFGVGAYTAVILTYVMNAPFYIAVPAGGAVSAVVGIGFGLPAIRLMGIYLCFSTLAGQKIMEFLFTNWQGLTGGADGISMAKTGIPGLEFKSGMILYYIIFALLTLMAMMAVNLMRSRFGRALCAIRDDQKVAEVMGIPAVRYKLLSFAVSSFYAGIAGALFSYYNLNISPGDFNVSFSIILIAMIIIGGMGSIPGSIYGAVVIVLLKEASVFGDRILPDIFNMSFSVSSLYEFAAGLLIALFIIFKPKGIAGAWSDVRSIFSSWPLSQVFNNGFK
jgi:branched-chain amino acid transport system permease protein